MMTEWEKMTTTMRVVGPRWRDRIKVAWQVLRGYNKMEFSMHLQVMRDVDAFVDAPVALFVQDREDNDAGVAYRTQTTP